MKVFGATATRSEIVALSAGVVLALAGLLLPNILLYVIGVALALVTAAWVGGGWVRAGAAAATFVLLVAGPWLWGDAVTNRDVAWKVDDLTDLSVTLGDRTYLSQRDTAAVVDTESGDVLWSSPDQVLQHVMPDGAFITYGRFRDPDGRERWSIEDGGDLDEFRFFAVTARGDGVTVLAEGERDLGGVGPQTVVGIADDGEIAWRREFSAVTIASNELGYFVDQDKLVPSTVAMRTGDDAGTIEILDPTTGKTLQSLPGGTRMGGALTAPIDERALVVTRADENSDTCSLALLQGADVLWTIPEVGCFDGPIQQRDLQSVSTDRVYLDAVGVAAIDLDRGTVTSPGDVGIDPVVADDAVVEVRQGLLIGHDPSSGEELWQRETSESVDVRVRSAGGFVVLVEPTRLPNPLLRHGFRWRPDEGSTFSDQSRRITLIDSATGEDVASAIDPRGAERPSFDVSGDGVMVSHDLGGPGFRLAP